MNSGMWTGFRECRLPTLSGSAGGDMDIFPDSTDSEICWSRFLGWGKDTLGVSCAVLKKIFWN